MKTDIHEGVMAVMFYAEFVVIHNGIITNYKDLKAFLVISTLVTYCSAFI
jgi:hypothetical protein